MNETSLNPRERPLPSHTTSPLPDLLRRVREATEDSIELDLAVTLACDVIVNRYSASVDAVLALIAERLPGWDWAHGYDSDKNVYRAEVWGEIVYKSKDAPTPALALLAAALEAIAMEQS